MQAKSDSNYVAVTRHRKFIGRNQFLSACPPILRATANDRPTQSHATTRLDDDDIWFSSIRGGAGGGGGGSFTFQGSGGSHAGPSVVDLETGNDGTHAAVSGGAVGGSGDDLISPHGNNPMMMMMESSEDMTAVAPHSSVSAIISYNERRRREDGWNDLGLDTIMRTNASSGNASLLSNVVPFESGGGSDTGTTTAQQQHRSGTTNHHDDDD